MEENKLYLTSQLISYIGNKRKLLKFIDSGIDIVKEKLGKDKLTILDGFAGSGIVSRYLKRHATFLHSNDFEYYSYIIGLCYLTNKSDIDLDAITKINHSLNNKKLDNKEPGIIRNIYSPIDSDNIIEKDRAFYTNENANIIDNTRRLIDTIPYDMQQYFLAPLLSEASVHVNTAGVFKGFYKNSQTKTGQWGGNAENCLKRIKGEIDIPIPILSNYECDWKMYNKDINKLILELPKVDVAYYDPPYNHHPYGSNYFMLNIIASYKEPNEISKVSGIPKDWQKSKYNKYNDAIIEFDNLIKNTKAKYIILSYNDEGTIPINELTGILSKYGDLNILTKNYTAYRGGRNRKERRNKIEEHLYILKKND